TAATCRVGRPIVRKTIRILHSTMQSIPARTGGAGRWIFSTATTSERRRREMTTAAEGAELTRVGPGTAMGELMRQYWIPAAKSSELRADGPPVRLMLLGEKLIAFRDSAGRVGVMDHRCPHRCASLFLGRNEEGGIRCIYHGWKYDVAGNCIDMASVPPHQDFKHKVKAKAYPALERAGVVWVYMGSRAIVPPLPAFEILDVPDDEVSVTFIQR